MSTLKEDIQTLKAPSKYKKAIAAAIGAAIPVVFYSLSDGHIDGGEWYAIGAAILGTFGFTFKAPPNKPK